MPRNRTPLEAAAGKLLQAATRDESIASAIGTRTVAQFLGTQWLHDHPQVLPYVLALEALEATPGA